MYRVQHIAKIWQRLLPSLGGGLGWGLMLILLLAGGRYANAQNTSSQPYIGSWHMYRVPVGNLNNTIIWELMQNSYTSPTQTVPVSDGLSWADTMMVDNAAVDSAGVEIQFIDAQFDGGQTWFLVYSEMNGNSCVARRYVQINPVDNSFNLVMGGDETDCNSYNDSIFDNTDGNIASIIGNSVVPFTVTMEKGADFRLTSWSFVASVSISGTGYSLPAILPTVVTDPGHGSLAFSGTGGSSFTGTVSGISTSDDFTSDAITFNVIVNGSPVNDFIVTLSINGRAYSGNNYTAVTIENNDTDNSQQKTIYGIPNTSVIAVTP